MIPTLYLETPIFPQTSNPQIPGFVTNRHMPPVNLSRSPVKAGCAESPHDAQGLMGGLCPRVEQTSHLSRAFPAVPCALRAWQAPHQIMTLETCGLDSKAGPEHLPTPDIEGASPICSGHPRACPLPRGGQEHWEHISAICQGQSQPQTPTLPPRALKLCGSARLDSRGQQFSNALVLELSDTLRSC